jgi:hypothetical protein
MWRWTEDFEECGGRDAAAPGPQLDPHTLARKGERNDDGPAAMPGDAVSSRVERGDVDDGFGHVGQIRRPATSRR